MLIITPSVVRRLTFSSSRCYHSPSRYDGYWTLILKQYQPIGASKVTLFDTNNNSQETIGQEATGETAPIDNASTSTITSTETTTPTSTQFVWLYDEKIPVPKKPPPPENCCMSGCSYCVYDIYQEDMETYQQQLVTLRQRFEKAGIELPEVLRQKETKFSHGQQEKEDDGMDPTMRAFLELEKKLNGVS